MTLRRAWLIAGVFAVAAVPAAAQFPPVPPPQPGQAPTIQVQPAQPQQQQPPPCVAEFMHLRDETEKKAKMIRAASDRHASPKEACGLFTTFTAAEDKLVKYAVDNGVWCGIPKEVVANLKQGHVQAVQLKTRVCSAAAQQQTAAPRQPTLSDALGAPAITDKSDIKTGRGTFDTLTGTPLGSR
jgi:hypothetical protein